MLHLSTNILQKDTVLDFVFGSSTENRITSYRLRRLVPRVLRLLRLDTKFSIELLLYRNSCIAEKYGDTVGKEIKISSIEKGPRFQCKKKEHPPTLAYRREPDDCPDPCLPSVNYFS